MKWAITYKPNRSGFTIVELLIVIVVIGILAAITIVSYNGIQARARAAAASSALEQVYKKQEIYKLQNNDTYPILLSDAGITSTSGTDFQYTPNNTTNPATFCTTATVGTTSYFLNSATTATPTAGSCPGHGTGGVAAVTNLATNPEAKSGGSYYEWLPRYGMTTTYLDGATDGPVSTAFGYVRMTQPSSSTGGGRGVDHMGNVDLVTPSYTSFHAWPVTSGSPMTISSYVRSSLANNAAMLIYRVHDGATTWLTPGQYCPSVNYTNPGTWVRLTCTFTPTATGYIDVTSRFQQSITWTTGATIDATALMVTAGSTLYNYADPLTSPTQWIWNGTVNNSTSTGPAI